MFLATDSLIENWGSSLTYRFPPFCLVLETESLVKQGGYREQWTFFRVYSGNGVTLVKAVPQAFKKKTLKSDNMEHQSCCLVNTVEVLCYWQVPLARKLGKIVCRMREPKLLYPRRPLAGKYDLGRTRRQWRRNIKAEIFGSVST